jgi:hypothetical protein
MAERTCEECGGPLIIGRELRRTFRRRFCSPKCRYRARDRRRYELDPEGERERSRRYYAANREAVLVRAKHRKAPKQEPPVRRECSECGAPIQSPKRVVCSKRCKDRHFERLHPERIREKRRRYGMRRRARLKASDD